MALLLRTPDKKAKLTKEELQYFVAYLDKSKSAGFEGINRFNFHAEREELYKFSLLTLSEKVLTKLFNNSHQLSSKNISFSINFAEEKTLLAIFKRVDCNSYLLAVQQKLMFQLRPLIGGTKVEQKFNKNETV